MGKLALFLNITSIVSIIGAVVIICLDKSGWGWLIFAAILMHCSPTSRDKNDQNDLK